MGWGWCNIMMLLNLYLNSHYNVQRKQPAMYCSEKWLQRWKKSLLCWVSAAGVLISTLIMWNRIRHCLILFRLRTIDLTLMELWLCCRVFSTVVAVSLHAWLKIVFKIGPCRSVYYDKTETEKQCTRYAVYSRYIAVQYNTLFHTPRH